jgi:hypothetical protein
MYIQNKIFFIKKESTFPLLKYPLSKDILERYDITQEMLDNVAITFSMTDSESGSYIIANVPANLEMIEDISQSPDNDIYSLAYKFTENQTKNIGRYKGEFCIDFLGDYGCGKIKLPIDGYIDIIITNSLTKTEVI